MHLLQNARHALLSLLLFSHLGKLTTRDGRLLIPLLELFVRQEVLSHDARDLFKIIKDGKSRILLPLIWWAEPAELVIGVERHRGSRLAKKRQSVALVKAVTVKSSTYN